MEAQNSQSPYAPPVFLKAEQAVHPSPTLRNRLMWNVAICLALLPLINYMYVVVFWCATCVLLGEVVRPGTHDPKDVLSSVPYNLHLALMVAAFCVFPLVVFVGYKCRKMVAIWALYAISFAISIVLFRLDLLEISTWIAD
jgi:hypothetical protein